MDSIQERGAPGQEISGLARTEKSQRSRNNRSQLMTVTAGGTERAAKRGRRCFDLVHWQLNFTTLNANECKFQTIDDISHLRGIWMLYDGCLTSDERILLERNLHCGRNPRRREYEKRRPPIREGRERESTQNRAAAAGVDGPPWARKESGRHDSGKLIKVAILSWARKTPLDPYQQSENDAHEENNYAIEGSRVAP